MMLSSAWGGISSKFTDISKSNATARTKTAAAKITDKTPYQKELAELKVEKLQADYESKIDLAVIEQRALALGMHRPTPDQIRYVSIGEGDTTQVFAMDEERDIFELVFDAFREAFANVTAYFS